MPVSSPPKVSVVIPCRNAERTVGAAVASALAQSLAPLEVIVVDDASTDGSARVAEAAGARVLRPERRGNAGGARNHGLEAATGELIAFMDADVEIGADWLALASAVIRDDATIAGVGGRIVDDRGGLWARLDQILNFSEWMSHRARYCEAYPTIAIVYRRDAIGEVRFPASNLGEDVFFGQGVIDKGWRLWFEPRVAIVHRHERLDAASFWNRQLQAGRGLFWTRRSLDRPGKILFRHPALLLLFPRLWIILGRLFRNGMALSGLLLFPWLLAGEVARAIGFMHARREAAQGGTPALGAAS